MVPAGLREPNFADSAEVWQRCPAFPGAPAFDVGGVGVGASDVGAAVLDSGAEDGAGGCGTGADVAHPVAHRTAAAVTHWTNRGTAAETARRG